MDIFASNFSLDAALQEHGVEAIDKIHKAISEQVDLVDAAIKKGLTPVEFAKAKEYRSALMAAFSIVALRYSKLNNI